MEEDELALSVVTTTGRDSQLLGLSRAALRRLREALVIEYWGKPAVAARFAARLAGELDTGGERYLLRHWSEHALDARVVAREKRDLWYDAPDAPAAGDLLVQAWNEMLGTAELWALRSPDSIDELHDGGDETLIEDARWILCCGADGEVAQLVVVEPGAVDDAAEAAAAALGITLETASA